MVLNNNYGHKRLNTSKKHNNNNSNKVFKMNSNRNFSFSKRLLNFNNRKFNKSSIKKSKKFDEIKTSLSFNSFNINNQNLNNYSIENTLNDLLLKRMTDILFITGSSSKNKQTKKQRKINLINVNNFFSPQINIIKVNKLNEKKIVDNKSKGKRKENVEIREKENEYNNNILQRSIFILQQITV